MFTSLRNLVNSAFATNNDTRDDEMAEENNEPHIPNDFELFTVRSFLLRFLPLELADVILDTAEYWPVVAEETHTAIDVVSNFTNDNNAGQYCLVTPPVPFKVRDFDVVPRLRCVKFKLLSNDQGWGGQSRYQGNRPKTFTFVS